MSIATGLIILVVVILAFAIVKQRASQGKQRPDERKNPASDETARFHSVSIKYAGNACDAAREMEGRRLLSSAAPRLPLADCDAEECNCRFVHHKDRRDEEDRRHPFPFGQGFGGGAAVHSDDRERRKARERRDEPPEGNQ